jgi:hypothetical protein
MLIGSFSTNMDRPTTLNNTKVTTITCQINSQLCLRGDLLNQQVVIVTLKIEMQAANMHVDVSILHIRIG